MESIGAFDAKTRLSELLKRAAQGEVFEITKNGHPVARLVPIPDADQDPSRLDRAIDALKQFRKTMPKVPIDELMDARHEEHGF